MKILFGIIVFFFGVSGSAPAEPLVIDLTGDAGHLPYLTEDYPRFFLSRLENGVSGVPGFLFDVDGDGFDDLIRSNQSYVCAVGNKEGNYVTYYQTNLPPEFCRETGHAFSLNGNLDLDGDGRAEVVVTGRTADHLKWRFWILDPVSGDILGSFGLDGGPEKRLDGKWDGNYAVAGTVEFSRNGADRTALVLTVNIGFDLEGRGVLAVDPWTGEVLWRFLTGPNPEVHSTRVVDLDGDGDGEVVVFGRAPHNLGGRKINGFSDDESRLFVLDHRGKLLWTQYLGGYYGGGWMITADLDDDGFEEIITSTFTTPEVWSEVAVWSHDGRALARNTSRERYHNIVEFPGAEGEPARLAAATVTGKIRLLEYRPPELTFVAEVRTGIHVHLNGVADFLPPEGLELVCSNKSGAAWILGNDLQPLARMEVEPRSWYATMMPWRLDPETTLLMRNSGPGFPVRFSRAPPPPPNPALILALAGALLLLTTGYFIRKGRAAGQGDPVVLREVRLHLLEDLELSNHGAIAPLKCLRRLIWHMKAMISGLGDNPSIEVRLRETWTESLENALPHLAGILDRARLAGLAGANVDFVARSLERIKALLEELEREGFQDLAFERMVADLTTETERADDALQDLRREVARYFHTDLASTVTRVLRANSQSIEEAGVTVQVGYLAQMAGGGDTGFARGANPSITCLIDPKEMDFVMDNLVANAVRAMKDVDHGNLSITWSEADSLVTVDVRDSGCGIPEEHRSRILETSFSTRKGGGEGLPRSRKILRKYGGGLMILDTAVGHGTTFRLTLPVAD